MSSGQKRVVLTNLERCVTSDVDRLQAFVAWTQVELERARALSPATDGGAGGDEARPGESDPAGPLTAVVVAGLRPLPDLAGTDLFVTPGALVCLDPDSPANTDDSPAKVVVDPGQLAAGALSLSAGDAALTRVDVVECRREEQVIENDNRDQFDRSSGLFVPVVVPKVVASRLVYRIRSGTPGAGFPGVSPGWLPLAVARVPALAATWGDCTLWDVRPLAADLARCPFAVDGAPSPPRARQELAFATSGSTIRGTAEGQIGQWRAGGHFPAAGISLGSGTDYREPGFVAAPAVPCFVWVAHPFGLPRWCRYEGAVPGAFRGLPIFSMTNVRPLDERSGLPASALALPTTLGMGGTTSAAFLAAATMMSNASTPLAFVVDGSRTWINEADGHVDPDDFTVAPDGVVPTTPLTISFSHSFSLQSNGAHQFPAGAKALRLRVWTPLLKIDDGAGGAPTAGANMAWLDRFAIWFEPRDGATPNVRLGLLDVPGGISFAITATEAVAQDGWDVWVPLPPETRAFATSVQRLVIFAVRLTSPSSFKSVGSAGVSIRGWEL